MKRKGANITKPETREYVRRYENGETITQIAKHFNRGYGAVQHYLATSGITMRNKGTPKKLTQEKLKEIKQLIIEGYSHKGIAEMTGMHTSTVCKASRMLRFKLNDAKAVRKNLLDKVDKLHPSEKRGTRRIPEWKQTEIYRLVQQGYTRKQIAKKLGIGQSTVYNYKPPPRMLNRYKDEIAIAMGLDDDTDV